METTSQALRQQESLASLHNSLRAVGFHDSAALAATALLNAGQDTELAPVPPAEQGSIVVSDAGDGVPSHPAAIRPALRAARTALAAGRGRIAVEVLPCSEAVTAHQPMESRVVEGRLALAPTRGHDPGRPGTRPHPPTIAVVVQRLTELGAGQRPLRKQGPLSTVLPSPALPLHRPHADS